MEGANSTITERIVEFKLEGFNKDMRVAFSILHQVYENVLFFDPNWHFFYEGDYSFLRCGGDFADGVRTELVKQEVIFQWPPKEWKEPWELTATFQDCFGPIFHNLSVLVMELFRRKNLTTEGDSLILNSADRIIHPFLNMATYLKYFKAGFGDKGPFVKWEAEVMASLTVSRAHITGMIEGEQRIKRIIYKGKE